MKISTLFSQKLKVVSRGILLITFFTYPSFYIITQAQTITSGTHVVVGTGAVVSSNNTLSVQSGGTLDVQGTLILKQNLVNQNSSATTLGSGLIELSGSSPQTISGQNIIQDLRINNASGITISGDTRVNGILKLKSGVISVGSNNLFLGPAASDSGGSVASMVDVTGTGQFRKEFASASSFTYPVGDQTGTPEYSPVTLNFTSGTFPAGNYVGVTLTDAKFNNDSISGNYITRYWTLSQFGISGFNCNATFNYLPADVVGTEGSIYCVKASPLPFVTYSIANTGTHTLTANGLSSFNTYTGGKGGLDIGLTAFLEGPYNAGTMNTTLNSGGLIPLTQPYNTSPWNYAGPETVASIPTGVVDWVLVELRQATTNAGATSATTLKRRAAFIKNDGTIVDINGTDPLRFYSIVPTSNLYPIIWHRNHLAIMANTAATQDASGKYVYDLSSGTNQIYGTGKIQLGSLWGMVAGNSDGSGFINNDDLLLWQSNFSQSNYNKADFDFTGFVNNDDLLKWQQNFSKLSTVPN